MKIQYILVISLVVASVSFAQGNLIIKKEHRQKQEQNKEQPAIDIPKAKGPISFGPLKIGMKREAIEALQVADGMYLNSPMNTYSSKYHTPKEGVDKFNAALSTELSTKPIEAILTFEAGRLTGIYLSFDQSITVFERVTVQISEKYGSGKVDNSRKEEQCVYKNGANFKVSSGTIATTWSENISVTERIETRTSDVLFDTCPFDLRDGSIGRIQTRSIEIRKLLNIFDEKPKNFF